jgi:hypothetical protein
MLKSALFQVLESLSQKEMRELGRFIRSPYINRRNEVSRLYDFIAKNISISEDTLRKEKIWKYVFPGKEYDDKEMRYAMSFLLKATRQFLIYQELNNDKVQSQVLLCRSLRHRGLGKFFEKEIEKTIKWQENQPYRNTRFHYNNYLIQLEQGEYQSQKTRRGDLPLQKLSDELTYFYIADFLRQTCTILTHQTVSIRSYDLNLLNEVLSHVETNDYSFAPAIRIYYCGYKALSDLNNEDHFKELKTLITKHWSNFPPNESREIYLMAINYCIKRLNKGDREYVREGFDLYRSGLQNDVFLEDKYLSSFTYKNISRLGLYLGEFDWVEKFLNHYKKLLYPQTRENTYLYNLAFFYFQKPDYDNAMELLQKVDFDDVLNNLDARRMLLRIYYELGEYDPLDSLLDSFKTYISRQKDIGYHKDNYLNLIRFVKKMIRSDLSNSSVKIKLIEEINITPAFPEQNWLLKQLE